MTVTLAESLKYRPQPLHPALERSSLRGLTFALRNSALWPEHFCWEEEAGVLNAVALTFHLWSGPPGWHPENEGYWGGLTGRLSDIPREDCARLVTSWKAAAYRIFGVPVLPRSPSSITPQLIAGRIEEYLSDKSEAGWPRDIVTSRNGEILRIKVRPKELYLRPGIVGQDDQITSPVVVTDAR